MCEGTTTGTISPPHLLRPIYPLTGVDMGWFVARPREPLWAAGHQTDKTSRSLDTAVALVPVN